MKRLHGILSFATVAFALSLVSCHNREEFMSNAISANWENKMGSSISPLQDWNMSASYSVSVNAIPGETYSVYAPVEGRYKLVGRYSGLTGVSELTFTALKGTSEVLMTNTTQSKLVRIGETVDFAKVSTRATISGSDGVVTVWDGDEIADPKINEILMKLPEEKDNVNRDDLSQNFFFNSLNSEEFLIYPVYSLTTNQLRIGIYYYDEAGVIHRQYIWEMDKSMRDGDNIYRIQNQVSTALHVKVPKFTNFGFFSERMSLHDVYYSQSKLNPCGLPHAATFQANGCTYLGIEDACNKKSDLNDLVLYMTPCPLIVDDDPIKWIIACEDMGNVGDYDFNDVVFEVSYISGENKLTMTPLAGGGNLMSTVFYNGVEIGEIHELLGAQNTEMVNTHSFTHVADPIALEVPQGFNLSDNMGKFSIKTQSHGEAKIISAPEVGSVPQMLLVPSTWAWPIETVSIEAAYPLFKTWNSNVDILGWTTTCDSSKVIIRK